MTDTEFHIGNIIKKELATRKLTIAWLARELHSDHSNLCKTLKKASIGMELLVEISIAMNRNFGEELWNNIENELNKNQRINQIKQ